MSFLLVGLGFGVQFGSAFKVPVRFSDVLPVLPRQVSWPVLNNFHSAVDLLPQYIGSLAPENGTIKWNGACFSENEAKIEFTGTGDRGIGGGVIHLSVSELASVPVLDFFMICVLKVKFIALPIKY